MQGIRKSIDFLVPQRWLRGFIALLAVGMVCVSCTKKKPEGSSVIALHVPSVGSANTKEGSFAAIPEGRKACFGVSITAADILGTPATTCSPKTGIVAGFVESGGTVQVEVPKGEGRTFELYMYLAPDGDTNPCPEMGKVFSAAQLAGLYFMGSASGVAINNPVEDVTITATFPGVAQTLATAQAYPANCVATTAPSGGRTGLWLSSAAGAATGGGMKLLAHVGEVKGPVLTGGGMKLLAR